MTEVSFVGGEEVRGDRPARVGRLRRPLVLLAIAVLCGAAYLAGIWTGMSTNVTCTTTAPGQIVCTSDGDQLPPPADPARPAATPTA